MTMEVEKAKRHAVECGRLLLMCNDVIMATCYSEEQADEIAKRYNRDEEVEEILNSKWDNIDVPVLELYKEFYQAILDIYKPKLHTIGALNPGEKCTFNNQLCVRVVNNAWAQDILKMKAPGDWTVMFNLTMGRIDVISSKTPCELVENK